MKKLIAALLFIPAMAKAEFMTGNSLLSDMQGTTVEQIYALGYVLGVADSAINVTVCPPYGINAKQVFDIIKNFLEANPDIRDYSGDIIVKAKLEAVWPCKQQSTGRNV